MFGWFKSLFNSPSNDLLLQGKYRYDKGKYDEALKLFNDYIASKPEDREGWYWKAITLKHKHPNEWYTKYNCSSNDYKEVYLAFKNAFGFEYYYDEIKQNRESMNKHIIYRNCSIDKINVEPFLCAEFCFLNQCDLIKIKTKIIDNRIHFSVVIGPFYDVICYMYRLLESKFLYCPWCRKHMRENIDNQNHHFFPCCNRINECINIYSDENGRIYPRGYNEFDIYLKYDKILKDVSFCPWCNAKIEIIEYHNSDSI